ncbi:hypothetical protein QE152_g25768 [Popillia japonica]|uniref:Uncharacterized protein n=1 Tax=Popillia japonica TaxID=7064 RepID=A0AAW1K0M6_POPJA
MAINTIEEPVQMIKRDSRDNRHLRERCHITMAINTIEEPVQMIKRDSRDNRHLRERRWLHPTRNFSTIAYFVSEAMVKSTCIWMKKDKEGRKKALARNGRNWLMGNMGKVEEMVDSDSKRKQNGDRGREREREREREGGKTEEWSEKMETTRERN